MSDSYDDFDRALLRAGRTAKAPSSLRAKALAAAAVGTATAAATTKLGVGTAKASGAIAAQAAHAFGLKAVLVASIGVTSVAFVLGGAYVAASRHADAVASAAPVRSPRAASPRAAEIGEVAPAAASPTQEATQEEPALPAKAEPAVAPAAEPAPLAAASPAPRAAASIKDVAPAPQGTGLARQVPSSAPSVTAVPAVDPLPREPSSEQAAPAPATPTFVLSDELRLIDAARAALARGDAPLALRFTAEHAARFPGGSLAIERDVLRVDALVAAGHIAEAASHACAFAARSPRSAQAPRMIKVGRCSSTIP
ncbi:hypothetical protein BE08_19360 [Sorangium cellulosum]|uniref:Uncharacterized protein n=1 Tax=Sorangium cellulosum TaxID=56 RepID=A0A150PFG9_SORCE|nr:hypothetical protein BE08_19360 [Sorangium cellulosum]